MRYIRYVVAEIHKDSGERLGIFQAAARLRDNGELDEAEQVWLAEVWSYFTRQLDAPTRFRRGGGVAAQRSGISWMKDSAHEHVRRLHELANLLRRHGVAVEMLITARPGYVVWEDQNQVLAVPFAPTDRTAG